MRKSAEEVPKRTVNVRKFVQQKKKEEEKKHHVSCEYLSTRCIFDLFAPRRRLSRRGAKPTQATSRLD